MYVLYINTTHGYVLFTQFSQYKVIYMYIFLELAICYGLAIHYFLLWGRLFLHLLTFFSCL